MNLPKLNRIIGSNINYKTSIIVLLLLLILFYNNTSVYSFIKNKLNTHNIIFTFWEPKDQIPGYLKLCLMTWKKYLPEYNIKILDYQNVKSYLGDNLFEDIICKNMTLPIQADAIRVAILNKYGGIWMDTDIIILNKNFIEELKNFELVMIGDNNIKKQDIGFIYAAKNSSLLNQWLKEIISKVKYFKKILLNKTSSEYLNIIKLWNYLGNGIIDNLLINISTPMFYRIDRNKINTYPERKFYTNSSLENQKKYQLFYFQKRDPQIVLNNSKDLLLLHNSWTPLKYKTMSEDEFLKQDILLSELLKRIIMK